MTTDQLSILHIAKAQLKLNDQEYRLILKNVGGVESGKDLDNQSLEKVMAFLEERGFRHKDKPEDYWRRKYHAQDQFAGERMVAKIRELHRNVKYPLDSLAAKASKGRTAIVEQLNPSEANNLVEMLKAMAARASSPTSNATAEAPRRRDQLVQGDLFGNPAPASSPEPRTLNAKPFPGFAAVTDEEVPF